MTEQKIAPLFTTRFTHGRRTFFFDVKKSKNEKPFLRITASSVQGEEKQRASMTIFESEIKEFNNAVAEVLSFIGAEAQAS